MAFYAKWELKIILDAFGATIDWSYKVGKKKYKK